jgi:hypothetical protein
VPLLKERWLVRSLPVLIPFALPVSARY